MLHGGEFIHPTRIVQEAMLSRAQFYKVNVREEEQNDSGPVVGLPIVQWRPPAEGSYKVNWDVMVDRNSSCL